jgi:hypothetical protein
MSCAPLRTASGVSQPSRFTVLTASRARRYKAAQGRSTAVRCAVRLGVCSEGGNGMSRLNRCNVVVGLVLAALSAGACGGTESPPVPSDRTSQPPSATGPNGEPISETQGADSAQCTHSPCQTGPTLVATCDWCVGNVCGVDAYCCITSWDAICVSEVASVCGQRCDCNQDCTTGNPFSAYACVCTANVCAGDAYCCRWAWDSVCVGELVAACSKHCP